MTDHIDNVRVAEGGEVWVTSDIITDDDLIQILDPNLRLPSKFVNLGLIDPNGFEHGYTENDAEVIRWGSGTVANKTVSREFTVKLSAMETTRDVVELFYGGTMGGNASYGSMNIDGPSNIRPEVCAVFLLQDGDVQWRLVLPDAYITEFEPPKFNAGQAVQWGMTLKAIDTYGYLAQWASNDPSFTQAGVVPAPLIQHPQDGDSVAGDVHVTGRGMYGATVHVESTHGSPHNVRVNDEGKWSVVYPKPAESESVTVTAYQTHGDVDSDSSSVNFTVVGPPDNPVITSIDPNYSRVTVNWTGTSIAPVDTWTWAIRKAGDTGDWETVYQSTTAGERFTFGLDCSKYPKDTSVDLRCIAAGRSGQSDPVIMSFTSVGWLPPTPTDPIVNLRDIDVSWSAVDIGFPLDQYRVMVWSDGKEDYRTLGTTTDVRGTFNIDSYPEKQDKIPPGTKVWLQIEAHPVGGGTPLDGGRTSFVAGNEAPPKAVEIVDIQNASHLVWIYPKPDPSTEYTEVNTYVYDKAAGKDTAVKLDSPLDWTKPHDSAHIPKDPDLWVDGHTLCFYTSCKTSGSQTVESDPFELYVIGSCNGPMLEEITDVQCRTVHLKWDTYSELPLPFSKYEVWFGTSDGKHGQPKPQDIHKALDNIPPDATEASFDPLSLPNYQPEPGTELLVVVLGMPASGDNVDAYRSNYRSFTMPKRLHQPAWDGGRTMQGGMERRLWTFNAKDSYPADHFQIVYQNPDDHAWYTLADRIPGDVRTIDVETIRGQEHPAPLYKAMKLNIDVFADDGTKNSSKHSQIVTEVDSKKVNFTSMEVQGSDTDNPVLHVEWDYIGGGPDQDEGTRPVVYLQYWSSAEKSKLLDYSSEDFADIPLKKLKTGEIVTAALHGFDSQDPAFDPDDGKFGGFTYDRRDVPWP